MLAVNLQRCKVREACVIELSPGAVSFLFFLNEHHLPFIYSQLHISSSNSSKHVLSVYRFVK